MLIPTERAFWILDYYRRHQIRLAFGASILGEVAACAATVTYVWRETHAIGIKLLDEDSDQVWDRLIPLARANFAFVQMGDPEFLPFTTASFHSIHSILMILFSDETTMFLAEPRTFDDAPFRESDVM